MLGTFGGSATWAEGAYEMTPPSFTFAMFPTVCEIPFHYPHAVTGKPPRATPGHVHESHVDRN